MRLVDRFDRLRRPWSGARRSNHRASRVGTLATGLRGTSPDGRPAEVAVDGPRLVLFFLTSGCLGCRAIWDGLGVPSGAGSEAGAPPAGAGHGDPSVVVVTPSPSTESVRTVAALAPQGVPVVMSSEMWHAYRVTGAPWCVVVAGGVVVYDSPAPTDWKDVGTLLGAQYR